MCIAYKRKTLKIKRCGFIMDRTDFSSLDIVIPTLVIGSKQMEDLLKIYPKPDKVGSYEFVTNLDNLCINVENRLNNKTSRTN